MSMQMEGQYTASKKKNVVTVDPSPDSEYSSSYRAEMLLLSYYFQRHNWCVAWEPLFDKVSEWSTLGLFSMFCQKTLKRFYGHPP